MRNFVLPILTLLATVCDFTSAVNKCLVGGSEDKCQYVSSNTLSLFFCGITDADLADLPACINNFGGDNIHLLDLSSNSLTTLSAGIFDSLTAVTVLSLKDNFLSTLPAGIFDSLTSLTRLVLDLNVLTTLPAGIFASLTSLLVLDLGRNELTTLPAGIFDSLTSLTELDLAGNADLECVPSASIMAFVGTVGDECGCDFGDSSDPCIEEALQCTPGADGYTCGCVDDCDEGAGEICCLDTGLCSVPDPVTGACGDPHMTGFLGQKFDFVGQDGEWYSVVSDRPDLQVNMRVTSPVTAEPEITYITGLGIKTIDSEGLDHTIVITVTDPHSLDTACPMEGSPCLADGALTVELDGRVALLSPGEVNLGPNLAISAANLPGACRSFGFEKYWERKKAEYAANGRKLDTISQMQMSDWILGDPTATNMAECTEYVLDATADGGAGLFEHESEHTSFQISTPKGSIRLSHGRLHQVATRDPTDRFDIPDHLTWQMNLAFDKVDLSPDATGILGETQQYTRDANGNRIMKGMSAIRGSQEDYLVEGPLDTVFAAAGNHP